MVGAVEIDNKGGRLDGSIIQAFEAVIGNLLPEDYRQFLLENNGGRPTPDVIDIENLAGGSTDVQVFFGIGREIESSDLRWNLHVLSEQVLSPGELPIACDSSGGVFCITLTGEQAGHIHYYDLQFCPAPRFPVTSSFKSFLQKLRAFDE